MSSCSPAAAALRLLCLYIERKINHPNRPLRLADLLTRENVEVVAALDLLREYDVDRRVDFLGKTDWDRDRLHHTHHRRPCREPSPRNPNARGRRRHSATISHSAGAGKRMGEARRRQGEAIRYEGDKGGGARLYSSRIKRRGEQPVTLTGGARRIISVGRRRCTGEVAPYVATAVLVARQRGQTEQAPNVTVAVVAFG